MRLMKNIPILCLGALLLLISGQISAEDRITDLDTYLAARSDYVEAEPVHKMIKLAKLLREGRVLRDQIQMLIRDLALQHIALRRNQGTRNATAAEDLLVQQQLRRYERERLLDETFNAGGSATTGAGRFSQARVQAMKEEKAEQERLLKEAQQGVTEFQQLIMAELMAWQELQQYRVEKGPLENIEIPSDIMDLTCIRVMQSDRRYVTGNPAQQLTVLTEFLQNGINSPFIENTIQSVFGILVEVETVSLPPAQQAYEKLKLIRDNQANGLLEWGQFLRGIEENALVQYLNSSPVWKQFDPRRRLAFLHKLQGEKLINPATRSRFEIPIAIQLLTSEPGFAAADKSERRSMIRSLRSDNLIDFLSTPRIEKALGVR